MENAEQILVVILASFLAVFLVVGIIAVTKLIQLLDYLKRVSEKIEKLAESTASLGKYLKYTTGPAAALKIMTKIGRSFFNHKKARSSRNDE
jgi:hypothetical protein